MRSTCSAVPARPIASSRASVVRRGHAGEGADLGVRQLAAGERLGQPRQRGQGTRHADLLAGRAEVEADAPGQPLGAGAKAGVPAAAGVEVADEIEQAGGGRIEMRGELGDLVANPLELGNPEGWVA